MQNDKVTVAICNFNTTDLTNNCIESLFKNVHIKPIKVIVLDNSSQYKFKLRECFVEKDIEVIDNTRMQVIDFIKMHKRIKSST